MLEVVQKGLITSHTKIFRGRKNWLDIRVKLEIEKAQIEKATGNLISVGCISPFLLTRGLETLENGSTHILKLSFDKLQFTKLFKRNNLKIKKLYLINNIL